MAMRPSTTLPLDFSKWINDQSNKPPPPKPRDMADTSAAHIFHVGPIKPYVPPPPREPHPISQPSYNKVDPRSEVRPKYNPQAEVTIGKDDSYLRVKSNKIITEHISTLDKIEIQPPRPRNSPNLNTTLDKEQLTPPRVRVNNNRESAPVPDEIHVHNLREFETSFDKQHIEAHRQVNIAALNTTYDKDQPVERPHIKLPEINPTYITTEQPAYRPQKKVHGTSFYETFDALDITESTMPHHWTFHVKQEGGSPEFNRHSSQRSPERNASSNDPNDESFAPTSTTSPQKRMTFAQPKRSLIERPYNSMPNLPFFSSEAHTPSRKPAVPRFVRKSNYTAPATVGGTLDLSPAAHTPAISEPSRPSYD